MELINIDRYKKESNKVYTYNVLKENIMQLNLKPGESISEIELSEALNVSRTPVREAIVKLEEKKLVTVFPQRGSFVSKINLNLVEEAVFLRELCEKKILEIACNDPNSSILINELEKNIEYQKTRINYNKNIYEFFELDNQFHTLIFNYYNKKNIWKVIEKLATHYDRLRLIDALEKVNLETTIRQHSEIVNLIKEKSSEKVNFLVDKHLFNYKEVIDKFIIKYPEYFTNF